MMPLRTYVLSVCRSTTDARVSAVSARMVAVSSIRLFVVGMDSPPQSSVSTSPQRSSAPQPPGPGLPLHAPSVQICTRAVPSPATLATYRDRSVAVSRQRAVWLAPRGWRSRSWRHSDRVQQLVDFTPVGLVVDVHPDTHRSAVVGEDLAMKQHWDQWASIAPRPAAPATLSGARICRRPLVAHRDGPARVGTLDPVVRSWLQRFVGRTSGREGARAAGP